MGLKILVIGSGGREHTIAQKFMESSKVAAVYCAKGNAGMKREGIQLVDIEETNHAALIEFAIKTMIDWTFVGPEIPLLNGIVDDFQAAGLLIFGPSQAAALIEGSKDFAKELMTNYQIPTAAYKTFTDFEKAKKYVLAKGTPIVIKADGLAAGKGVVVAETKSEALKALEEMLLEQRFGKSGTKVVIEEFLAGEEFSLLAFVRGTEVYPMVIAQDHKRVYENDLGPNTGGMGAYSPVPQISEGMVAEAVEQILKPAADGLVKEGRSFTGILYAGLIATSDGAKVIEFNARFGDPETQVVLQRLESDFASVIDCLLKGKQPEIRWQQTGFSLGVVVAAKGYPGSYPQDIEIPFLESSADRHIYYSGVTESNGQLQSTGGRILLVEGTGETLLEAQDKVYEMLNAVNIQGTFYRKDIGFKGLK